MNYITTHQKPPLSFPSVSGSIVTFNSQYAGLPLKSHTVEVVATQSGSGTPSPSNPRPISGYSAINISHSDADTSNPTVYTIQIGSTVYGGEYDAVSGVFRCTHEIVELDGTNPPPTKYTTNRFQFVFGNIVSSPAITVVGDIISDKLQTVSRINIAGGNYRISFGDANTKTLLIQAPEADVSDMITWLSTNKPIVVYPLATPFTIQLPPCPIETLLGENNIWADTGDTTLQYPKFG